MTQEAESFSANNERIALKYSGPLVLLQWFPLALVKGYYPVLDFQISQDYLTYEEISPSVTTYYFRVTQPGPS
jgi:hypothetical protein